MPPTQVCIHVLELASMQGTYGLDTTFNTCQALSSALTSDSSHWANGWFSPELLMTLCLHNSTTLITKISMAVKITCDNQQEGDVTLTTVV